MSMAKSHFEKIADDIERLARERDALIMGLALMREFPVRTDAGPAERAACEGFKSFAERILAQAQKIRGTE